MDSDVVLSVLKVITEFRQSLVFDFLYRDVFGSYLPIGVLIVDGLGEDVRCIAAVAVLDRKDLVIFRHRLFVDGCCFGGINNVPCVAGHHGRNFQAVFHHGSLAKELHKSTNDHYSCQQDSHHFHPEFCFMGILELISCHEEASLFCEQTVTLIVSQGYFFSQ